ncbi:FecR domain-containing protein [Algoriphagus sp. H41]|uniref:FecR domain-containing protein n=1 Tax=Algoriphagus oliviformis TaxID=2811231 RepID=A0ABS3BZ94_9BACT|nr:FecR domain-containing protein [Algoriphagus oliviformis]MBN7809726.1 FecR domain-containing protein [Algoriphagus oliviformis]
MNEACTPEEHAQVKKWLDLPGSREELDQILLESWEASPDDSEDEAVDRMLDNIHREIRPSHKIRPWKPSAGLLKIAASFILLGLVSLGLFRYSQQEEPVVEETLTVYTKETRVGEKLRIRLPDQTYVVLNANSKIEFDSDYGKAKRMIKVSGEAFFDVASNEKVPFIVDSGELQTTALGTEFNVFSRDGLEKIALTEGKVKVEIEDLPAAETKFLEPGQMATLKENAGEISAASFDPLILTAWKEGRIRFKRSSLKDIVANLQTWYGVEIQVQKSINLNRKVSGEFNNESLENILEGLSFSMGFQFEINENQVSITN